MLSNPCGGHTYLVMLLGDQKYESLQSTPLGKVTFRQTKSVDGLLE
jgi:hypothetical protein